MDEFDGTFDEVSSGPLTIDKQVDYAVLRKADSTEDVVIMTNGAETPQRWNQSDSTVDNVYGTPTDIDFYPSCIETHRYRMWAAGVPSYPYRLYYSAESKYDDWNTTDDAGYIDIIDSVGSKLTAIVGGYNNYLITFSEYSVGGISGSTATPTSANVFTPFPIMRGLGAVNNAGVIVHGNDIYFVSYKGIHALSTTEKYGDIRETYLSADIQEDFNALNRNRLEYCCGAVWPELNYLIWSFAEGGQTTNNVCFVYDYIGKRWSKWTGINASCFAVVKNG
jgi:hypothetical protein